MSLRARNAYDPRVQKVEVGWSWVWGQPGLPCNSKASMKYIVSPYLINKYNGINSTLEQVLAEYESLDTVHIEKKIWLYMDTYLSVYIYIYILLFILYNYTYIIF